METYLIVAQIPAQSMVGILCTNIAPRHFNEIRPYITLNYTGFRDKLVEIFTEPDLIQAYIQKLARVAQDRDEEILIYMNRVRLLVLRAHPDLEHSERERILIATFIRKLYDRGLRLNLATLGLKTSADAERVAMSKKSIRKENRLQKATGAYAVHEEADEDSAEECSAESEEDEDSEEEYTAAAPERS